MKCGKRKRGKKEIRVEVMKVFFFSPSLPLSSILAGWSPQRVPYPPKNPKSICQASSDEAPDLYIYQLFPFQTSPLHLWIPPYPSQSDAFWLLSTPLLSLPKLIHLIFSKPILFLIPCPILFYNSIEMPWLSFTIYPYLSSQTQCHGFFTYSSLSPAYYPCFFQCQAPNPTLWEALGLQPV